MMKKISSDHTITLADKVEQGIYPSYEQFYQKYVVEGLGMNEIARIYNIGRTTVGRLRVFFHLDAHNSEQVAESYKKTLLSKYGVSNTMSIPGVSDKIKKTVFYSPLN